MSDFIPQTLSTRDIEESLSIQERAHLVEDTHELRILLDQGMEQLSAVALMASMVDLTSGVLHNLV